MPYNKRAKKAKTIKIVVNRCYGGFGLSEEAYEYLIKLGVPSQEYVEGTKWNNERIIYNDGMNNSIQGKYWDCYFRDYQNRTDELLIKTVEDLKEKANGQCAELEIVEIPEDVNWDIDDYDGVETVEEVHREW
jgi:hypothetical protein